MSICIVIIYFKSIYGTICGNVTEVVMRGFIRITTFIKVHFLKKYLEMIPAVGPSLFQL